MSLNNVLAIRYTKIHDTSPVKSTNDFRMIIFLPKMSSGNDKRRGNPNGYWVCGGSSGRYMSLYPCPETIDSARIIYLALSPPV